MPERNHLIQLLAIPFIALLGLSPCQAKSALDLVTVRSSSEQFIVYGSPPDALSDRRRIEEGNTNAVTMNPSLTAISCERIKQVLLRQLDASDGWRGPVHVILRREWPGSANCSLSANHFRDGWSYRLELPQTIEPRRLIEVVARVLLIEMANRGSRDRSIELPLWLAEGFPPFLALISSEDLVAKPPAAGSESLPVTRVVRNKLLNEDFFEERARFAQRTALTVQQLSWPEDQLLTAKELETYRESAQWFVYELLHMKDGSKLFRAFLGYLPQYQNWQVAFFAAYKPRIETPLDLEKWWALQLTAINPAIAPTPVALDRSLALLDEVLRSPMQVRIETNDRPLQVETSLQQALKELDEGPRLQLARETVLRLQLARPRLAPTLVAIADEYQTAIAEFITTREAGEESAGADSSISIKRVDGPPKRTSDPLETLVEALNQLDNRRATLAMPSVASSSSERDIGQR